MLEIALKSGLVHIFFTLLKSLLVLGSLGYVIKSVGEVGIGFFHYIQAGCAFLFCFTGNIVLFRGVTQYVAERKNAPFSEYQSLLGAALGFLCLTYAGIEAVFLLLGSFEFLGLNPLHLHTADLFLNLSLILGIDFLQRFNFLISAYLNGKQKIVLANTLKGIYEFVTPLVVLGMAWVSPTLLNYGLSLFVMGLLKSLHFYLYACRITQKFWLPNLSFRLLSQMPVVTRTAYLGSLADPLHGQVDRLILGYWGGVSTLPVYAMVHRFRELIVFLLDGICRTYFPVLSAEGANALHKAKQIDYLQRWVVSLIVFTFSLGMLIFAPLMMTLMVTPEFGERSRIFVILASLQNLAYCHSFIPLFGLLALKNIKETSIFNWLEALFVVVFIYPLMLLFGDAGAGLSRLATFPQTLYINRVYGKLLDFNWRAILAPIELSFVLFGVALLWPFYLYWYQPGRWVEMTGGCLVFAGMMGLRLFAELFSGHRQEKQALYLKIKNLLHTLIRKNLNTPPF
ncbi:hypothetical protein WDW89_21025 [Deltaproteobacteria bacterium TL4]